MSYFAMVLGWLLGRVESFWVSARFAGDPPIAWELRYSRPELPNAGEP
jgi:hypothetical protein